MPPARGGGERPAPAVRERARRRRREWDAGTKDGTLDSEALSVRYAIEFDMESIPRLCDEHGLVHPMLEQTG